MNILSVFFCFFFFITTLLSHGVEKQNEQPPSHEDQHNSILSQCKQECHNEVIAMKNGINEILETIKKEQNVLASQYEFMNGIVKKLENNIEQYQNQFQTVQSDISGIPQLKKEFDDVKEEVKKLKHLPSQISDAQQKFNQNFHKLENNLKFQQKEIKQIMNATFMNVVSETSTNFFSKIKPGIQFITNKIGLSNVTWFQNQEEWKKIYEYLMENVEYGKFYVSDQLAPAFSRQVTDQYARVKKFCIDTYNEINRHKLYKSALKQAQPYFKQAQIHQKHHQSVMDGIMVVGFIIILMITYCLLMLISGLICPKVPKNREEKIEKTDLPNKNADDVDRSAIDKNNKKNADANVDLNDKTKNQNNNDNVKPDDNKINNDEQNKNAKKSQKPKNKK